MITDLHCDTIFKVLSGEDVTRESAELEGSLPALKQSGIRLQIFAAFVSSAHSIDTSFAEAERLLKGIDRMIAEHADELVAFSEYTDYENVLSSDKTGIMKAVENGQAIENDLKKLEYFRKEGVRYMTLTHSRNHDWASSSGESTCDFDGLTAFGEKVIAAMNDLGIIVDVSHVHERTFWKVHALSRKPIIASHSNAYSLCPTPRNLKDDQIKAIADSGGMIGINFFPGFLDALYLHAMTENTGELFQQMQELEKKSIHDPDKLYQEMKDWTAEFREKMTLSVVGLDRIVDHVEYIFDLVGEDFVGFGSDFDGIPALPEGIDSAADMGKIVDRMRERNFSETQIQKVCRDNFKRVLRLGSPG